MLKKDVALVKSKAILADFTATPITILADEPQERSVVETTLTNEKGNELNTTQEGLEVIVNYDELINIINSTKALEEYLYTSGSWKLLIDFVAKAESMVEAKDLTLEEVNNAVAKIQGAVGNLVEIKEKGELKKLLAYADTIRDIGFVGALTCVEIRWSNFQIYREVARESLLNHKRTQKDTEVDIWCLNYYIKELKIRRGR